VRPLELDQEQPLWLVLEREYLLEPGLAVEQEQPQELEQGLALAQFWELKVSLEQLVALGL
jgi:hypothetical protein